MKLHANIGDTAAAIELHDQGDRVRASIDGRAYDLNLTQVGAGRYVFISEAQLFECRVEGANTSNELMNVFVGNRQFTVTVTDPKRLRSAANAAAHGAAAARIVAPMPGKVVRVLVEVGTAVEAGDGIVVVEAMKMQNEMKSPKAGTVSALKVGPGETVNSGDLLAVIE